MGRKFSFVTFVLEEEGQAVVGDNNGGSDVQFFGVVPRFFLLFLFLLLPLLCGRYFN